MQSSFRQIWSIELSATHSADLGRRLAPPPAATQGTTAARRMAGSIWPGLILAGMVAATGFSLQRIEGLSFLSPMILAVLVGIVFANLVGHGDNARAGIAFCQRGVLRFAVVLLGSQLTAGQIQSIGAAGIGIVAASLAATFCFTLLLGRALGVDRKLAELIAAGTSICGASAIVATNAVTGAHDEDVAYAVAVITLFGTIALIGYPLLAPLTGLDQHGFGLWAGASIHEVAQVVGASFQNGPLAGEIGTVAKLARVAMLAPMVIMLGLSARRGAGSGAARPPVPWFVLAFVAVVAFNSVYHVPPEAKRMLALATTILLSLGLAAMGLQTDISKIRLRGIRPLILALSAFVFIACFSLLLVELAG
jgi:uncharacterized integral membrane protein (TIGR00698 family)